MSGTKTFDPDQALDVALSVFWERGYAATSVQNLVDRVGLNRSSLYATFGGKEALFAAVLARYVETVATPRHRLLEAGATPLAGLEQFLQALAEVDAASARGCLVVNTTAERLPADTGTAAVIARQLRRLESALTGVLARARDAGELRAEIDPRAGARMLVVFIQGMRVVGKTPDGATTTRAGVVALLAGLRKPA